MNLGAGTLSLPRFLEPDLRTSVIAVACVALTVGGLLYFGMPVDYLPALLGVVILCLITLRSPFLGLNIVIAAQYLPLRWGGFTVLQLTGFLVAALSLVWYGLSQRGVLFGNIVWPILVFILLTLYSFTFTRDPLITSYALRKLALNAIFCLLLVNLIDRYDRVRAPLWVLVFMAVLNSLVAGFQFPSRPALGEMRSPGLQENENQLGEIAALAFVIPFYYFLYADRWWKRLIGIGLCVILAVGLITSVSRGAVLALLCGLAFMLVREKRYRGRLLFCLAVGALAVPYLPAAFHHRFQNLGSDVRMSVDVSERVGLTNRGYFNKAGIRIWKAHPWLGVGLGNYGYYFIIPGFNPGARASHRLVPHNMYIQALAETGVIGFLVLCWWILQAAFNYWVAEKKVEADSRNQLYLRACETITLVALIVYFSSGTIGYTHMTMVLTLSYVCRRCAAELADPVAA